jgi:hypothetical protein
VISSRKLEKKYAPALHNYRQSNLNSKEKVNGIFLSKTLNVLQSEVHFLLHKMLDFSSLWGALPPWTPYGPQVGPRAKNVLQTAKH